jgi:hypothetical protein
VHLPLGRLRTVGPMLLVLVASASAAACADGPTSASATSFVVASASVLPGDRATASRTPVESFATTAWGPVAVVPPQDGADTARTEGTLRITDMCVLLDVADDFTLLVWPADRTTWDASARTISFANLDGTIVTVGDGMHVVVGGSGDDEVESGTTSEEWLSRTRWVAPPDVRCPMESRWMVGALNP